jgi:hypothetical protein
MSEYKKPKYTTEGEKVYPFYDKILTSMGFDVTELFNNLDIIEKISSRSDITLYDQSTEKIKNTIFQNIYNNLAYILKSKGTDKSFKSLLRSYGVDDNLVRVNLYADNTSSDVFNRTKEAVVKKKTITLVNDNSIFLSSSAVQENSSLSYYTFESCLSFPAALKPTSNTTSSICGVQNNIDQNLLDWSTNNNHYYVTVETDIISGSRFVLTNKYGGFTSSDYFEDLYDNSIWNICLRKKPDVDTLIGVDYTPNYTIELYGINETGDKKQEFSCSLPHSNEDGYLRYYIGARKEDLTGTSIYNTAVKYLYCNFWSDYLNNNVIVSHNKELMNYGVDE